MQGMKAFTAVFLKGKDILFSVVVLLGSDQVKGLKLFMKYLNIIVLLSLKPCFLVPNDPFKERIESKGSYIYY
jgi:hypothetical protein